MSLCGQPSTVAPQVRSSSSYRCDAPSPVTTAPALSATVAPRPTHGSQRGSGGSGGDDGAGAALRSTAGTAGDDADGEGAGAGEAGAGAGAGAGPTAAAGVIGDRDSFRSSSRAARSAASRCLPRGSRPMYER